MTNVIYSKCGFTKLKTAGLNQIQINLNEIVVNPKFIVNSGQDLILASNVKMLWTGHVHQCYSKRQNNEYPLLNWKPTGFNRFSLQKYTQGYTVRDLPVKVHTLTNLQFCVPGTYFPLNIKIMHHIILLLRNSVFHDNIVTKTTINIT